MIIHEGVSHTTLNHQLPKSRSQLCLKPGQKLLPPESNVFTQQSSTISQVQGNKFNSDGIHASSPLYISITVQNIFMKQISINIRRCVIHKEFNSVFPFFKKKIKYDPLKRKLQFNRVRSVIEVPRQKKKFFLAMVRLEIFSSNVHER